MGSEREAVVTTMEDSVRVELSWSRLGAWNMLHWVGRVEYRDQRTQVAALGGTGKRGGVKIRGGGAHLAFSWFTLVAVAAAMRAAARNASPSLTVARCCTKLSPRRSSRWDPFSLPPNAFLRALGEGFVRGRGRMGKRGQRRGRSVSGIYTGTEKRGVRETQHR